jgi:hypothetical protein
VLSSKKGSYPFFRVPVPLQKGTVAILSVLESASCDLRQAWRMAIASDFDPRQRLGEIFQVVRRQAYRRRFDVFLQPMKFRGTGRGD